MPDNGTYERLISLLDSTATAYELIDHEPEALPRRSGHCARITGPDSDRTRNPASGLSEAGPCGAPGRPCTCISPQEAGRLSLDHQRQARRR
jgi:hypothetical protein